MVFRLLQGIFWAFLTIALLSITASAKPLFFVLDTPTSRFEEANLIAAQLKEVGVSTQVRVWTRSELHKAISTMGRTAYLTDWGSSFFDPFDLAVPKLSTGGRGNFSFYSNPQVDKLLAIAATSSDGIERREAYHRVQKIIHAQVPWVFGYTIPRFDGASASVLGYTPSLDSRINLHDLALTTGDTLVVALATDAFSALDPAAFRGRETETVVRNIFDGLVTRKPDGTVVMELAESYVRVNPTTYVFTLREGPMFHNGEPVTAEDVVFTFERVLSPYGLGDKASPRKGLLGPLNGVEALNARQVRFKLNHPFPHLLHALVHFQVVPKQYVQKVGETAFNWHPVGAGPFKFAGGTLETEVRLQRFDGYYGGSPDLPPVGPAKFKHAVFLPIADDQERVDALLDGQAHIAQGLPMDRIKSLRSKSDIGLFSVEGTRSYQIELNNGKSPFNDMRTRMAVNLALDWETIIKTVYHGYGKRLPTCFLPSGFGFNEAIAPLPHDPQTARGLLRAAGYSVE